MRLSRRRAALSRAAFSVVSSINCVCEELEQRRLLTGSDPVVVLLANGIGVTLIFLPPPSAPIAEGRKRGSSKLLEDGKRDSTGNDTIYRGAGSDTLRVG
jgi:hypothetical protein